jgi:VWFA-related protein
MKIDVSGSLAMRARRPSFPGPWPHLLARRSLVRGLALGVSAVAAVESGGAPAQVSPAPPSASAAPTAPVIPGVGTELIRVEAVVFDRQGRPVRGLAARDFRLLEDGVSQALTHFQPASGVRDAALAGGARSASDDDPAEPSAASGRRIVLAVDDLHMAPTSLSGAKIALKRFLLEGVTDEDEVAIVTTSGALGLFQAFTQERAVLRRAVDRLACAERRANAGGRATLSEYEAEAIDRGDHVALDLATQEIKLRDLLTPTNRQDRAENPRVRPEAVGMARTLLEQALEVTNKTLSTLEEVVHGLGRVPGRKLLVLVSDGFVIGHGTRDARAFDMRRIFDASARSGVAVYALDTRGVVAEPTGGGAAEPSPVDTSAIAAKDNYAIAGRIAYRESMSALAEGTGGFLVHGTNDLGAGLGRILADSDAGYLLAYVPSHLDRDGRYRTIAVEVVGHPEYTVRARKGYFAPDDKRRVERAAPSTAGGSVAERQRQAEIKGALSSLVPLADVPLEMAADFVALPPDGPQLVIRAHVDLNGVPFETKGDRRQAELELVGVVYDEAGTVVGDIDGQQTDLDLAPDTYERLLRDGLRFQKTLALKPGLYQVRLVVREGRSARIGTTSRWVEIPDLGHAGLTLSSLFLLSEADRGAASEATAPAAPGLRDVQARRRFLPGQNLYYVVYVYNPALDAAGGADVVLQAQVWSGGKLQGVSPVEPVAVAPREEAPRPVTGRVTLEGLPSGDYELRVVVVDRKADANALRRVPFTIG